MFDLKLPLSLFKIICLDKRKYKGEMSKETLLYRAKICFRELILSNSFSFKFANKSNIYAPYPNILPLMKLFCVSSICLKIAKDISDQSRCVSDNTPFSFS